MSKPRFCDAWRKEHSIFGEKKIIADNVKDALETNTYHFIISWRWGRASRRRSTFLKRLRHFRVREIGDGFQQHVEVNDLLDAMGIVAALTQESNAGPGVSGDNIRLSVDILLPTQPDQLSKDFTEDDE